MSCISTVYSDLRVYALTYFTTTIISLRTVISVESLWWIMKFWIIRLLHEDWLRKLLTWRPQKFEGISQFCFDVILSTQYRCQSKTGRFHLIWNVTLTHDFLLSWCWIPNFYLIFSRLLRKVVQFFTLLQMCRVVQINFLKMSRLKLLKELVWFSTCQREHMTAARKIQSKWWEFNSFIRLSWIRKVVIDGMTCQLPSS